MRSLSICIDGKIPTVAAHRISKTEPGSSEDEGFVAFKYRSAAKTTGERAQVSCYGELRMRARGFF